MGALLATVALVIAGCGSSTTTTTVYRAAPTTGQQVPLRIGHSPRGGVVVLAPVYINGQGPFPFVIDTGASRSVIDQGLAHKLGFTISPSHQKLTGVNASQAAGRISVGRWRVGDVRLPAEPVLTLSLASDQRGHGLGGLLGSDNLSRFGSFLLDYAHGDLVLSAR